MYYNASAPLQTLFEFVLPGAHMPFVFAAEQDSIVLQLQGHVLDIQNRGGILSIQVVQASWPGRTGFQLSHLDITRQEHRVLTVAPVGPVLPLNSQQVSERQLFLTDIFRNFGHLQS